MTETGPLDGASPALVAALTIRFALELALLVGVAVLAWQVTSGWWQWPAAIISPAAVAIVWGLFLSPRATVSLPEAAKLAIEAALFLGAGAGLFFVGLGIPAAVGVTAWIIDRIALALLPS